MQCALALCLLKHRYSYICRKIRHTLRPQPPTRILVRAFLFWCTIVCENKTIVIVFGGLLLMIPAIYIHMRCVNIYICGLVTINGEKRLGGATKLKRGGARSTKCLWIWVLWCSLVWSDEIWVNKHIVMRHSFWNGFHGSHGSPWLLVFKDWSVGSCVNRAPPPSGSSVSPSPLHLNVDGTILIAGCGSSAGQRSSTTRSNNGQAERMT